MIASFRDKETEAVYLGQRSAKLPPDIQARARNLMNRIDQAHLLRDLAIPPGNGLHPLSRDRVGQHALKINKQWRICFHWRDGHAYHVEITDYHS